LPAREASARDDASSCESIDGFTACARVIARSMAPDRGDADERIVCSLTIRKVFVLTLSFQAKVFL
jgi:hypothetical protein